MKVRQSLLTSINWDNIITPGCYTINNYNFSNDSLNYPKNIYPWGILYITQASDGGIQQIYIPHHSYAINEYYTIAHRMKFVSGANFEEWNYASSRDYFNISFASTGYIIFLNGLIIQWGVLPAIQSTTITGESTHITVTYPTSFKNIIPGDIFFHFEYTNPWESKNRLTVLGLHNYTDVTLNSLKLYLVGINIDNTVTSASIGGNAHYFCIGF